MFRTVRLLSLAALAVLVLSGATCQKKPPIVPVGGQHTVTTELRYIPIDPALTAPCTVAEGPLREVIAVARERRACIERLNARMAEIAAIQGTKPAGQGQD